MEENKRPSDFKVEKVTSTAQLKKDKKKKLADVFVAEDISKISDHITFDVLVPAIKKLIIDIFNNTLNSLFYGTGVPTQDMRGSGNTIRYGSISTQKQQTAQPIRESKPEDMGNIMVDSYETAQKILTTLDDIISTYRVARVSDLCEAAGISYPYTYNNYGWASISTATIKATAGGFLIVMPKCSPIES